MATYRRTVVRRFTVANAAYINTPVTFYTADLTTGQRTSTLATLYDAPSGGNEVGNPYTLDSAGKSAQPLYFEEPIIAVINSSTLGTHESGIIFPLSGTWRGDWAASISYLPGDLITDGAAGNNTNNIYVCKEGHTSTASFATDLATYWVLGLDVTTIEEYATAAAASASAASDSEIAAAASEAATAADVISTNADVISTNADAASTAADVITAAGHASDASDSADLAEDWATTPEDTTVPGGGGEYSAKHYSAKAQAAVGGVKVSANDTTPDTLDQKLVAGAGITSTENNDGGDESVTIAVSDGDVAFINRVFG